MNTDKIYDVGLIYKPFDADKEKVSEFADCYNVTFERADGVGITDSEINLLIDHLQSLKIPGNK